MNEHLILDDGRRASVFDPHTYVERAVAIGVPEPVARSAHAHVRAGLPLLSMSGRMYAGKDTIGPAVLAVLGATQPEHLYFANALKDELDTVIGIVAAAATPAAALDRLAADLGAAGPAVEECVTVLWDLTRGGNRPSSRSRTDEMRLVLQRWGTDVRRATDPDYWVRIALADAVRVTASGRPAYFSDTRFPNEVAWSQAFGFAVVRLEVSFATQRARALARDGLDLAAADPKLAHASETALDGYVGFDLVVDNDHDEPDRTVAVIADRLRVRAAV